MKRKYKRYLIYVLLLTVIGGVFSGSIMIKNNLKNNKDLIPVNEQQDTFVPVVKLDEGTIRPYNDPNVTLLRGYYDYESDESSQLDAIILYNNTYMQNTGNIYGSDNKFDVLAIADGEVVNIEDSEISGKVITIKHNEDITSTYQFLDDVTVSVNKKVKRGDKLGTSGISNLVDNSKNQLYFELLIRDNFVDAEKYYGKDIKDF